MGKYMVSATKVWLSIVLILLNVSAVWGDESGAQQKVREYYERKGAELAACKGDRVCLDRVKGEHARERARTRRMLMAPIDMSKFKKTMPKSSEATTSDRPQVSTEQQQGTSSSAPKKDEFDLGDLDF